MNNNDVLFGSNLSIGVLNVVSMEMERIDNVTKEHRIFNRIVAPFDWYFHDEIMIIPDVRPTPKKNWNKVVNVCEQEIECIGECIYFFHFEIVENKFNYVTSLTLPEFDHIRKGISLV